VRARRRDCRARGGGALSVTRCRVLLVSRWSECPVHNWDISHRTPRTQISPAATSRLEAVGAPSFGASSSFPEALHDTAASVRAIGTSTNSSGLGRRPRGTACHIPSIVGLCSSRSDLRRSSSRMRRGARALPTPAEYVNHGVARVQGSREPPANGTCLVLGRRLRRVPLRKAGGCLPAGRFANQQERQCSGQPVPTGAMARLPGAMVLYVAPVRGFTSVSCVACSFGRPYSSRSARPCGIVR
jgi:hypothetical protein